MVVSRLFFPFKVVSQFSGFAKIGASLIITTQNRDYVRRLGRINAERTSEFVFCRQHFHQLPRQGAVRVQGQSAMGASLRAANLFCAESGNSSKRKGCIFGPAAAGHGQHLKFNAFGQTSFTNLFGKGVEVSIAGRRYLPLALLEAREFAEVMWRRFQ